ncbi:hypothetical protein [Aureibacter tunicatorum]|uniref:Uncharacterized protein n=1 Tax=Aureibacter tunicatorum TaxID=866807 RepID=A0AAE3XPG9_9BACT|nr:hypothetical protein [Aureibacter tunicatorum]MDR6240202.1 hypothetical protein [Aureibacter tunicatorum]BDD05917.1 hypothetical protein AUTU_34000 [Aureibacter tunicatorum]
MKHLYEHDIYVYESYKHGRTYLLKETDVSYEEIQYLKETLGLKDWFEAYPFDK